VDGWWCTGVHIGTPFHITADITLAHISAFFTYITYIISIACLVYYLHYVCHTNIYIIIADTMTYWSMENASSAKNYYACSYYCVYYLYYLYYFRYCVILVHGVQAALPLC
jgi:hypothetical protein